MNINKEIQNNKDTYLNELFELLRIPSISTDKAFYQEIKEVAKLFKKALLKVCDKVNIYQTSGNPIVYGEKIIDPNAPTILVYGHYDVQPANANKWGSKPFEPIIKTTSIHPEGAIFARGVSDDKGQVFMHIKALELILKTGKLKCNIKFIIEGEEEIGSKSIIEFVRNNKELLVNDVILISDTVIINKNTPSITTGLRGLTYLELTVKGPDKDLHSGLYGGVIANPIYVLAEIISKLKDDDNKITIPNFYDNVEEVSMNERKEMSKSHFDINNLMAEAKVHDIDKEKGYTPFEQLSIRPSLNINGIYGGYTGEGGKTIVPSYAKAKISMRLMPNQNYKEVAEMFSDYVKELAPKSVKVKVDFLQGCNGYSTSILTKEYLSIKEAFKKVYGKNPIPQRNGGSLPIVSVFEEELKSKSILMGFGLNSDNVHSANEHFGIDIFLKGIEVIYYSYLFLSDKNEVTPINKKG